MAMEMVHKQRIVTLHQGLGSKTCNKFGLRSSLDVREYGLKQLQLTWWAHGMVKWDYAMVDNLHPMNVMARGRVLRKIDS